MVWCCFLAKNAYLCIRVSHIRPAPAELPQGRKAARVCGCSGAIYSAYPFFIPVSRQYQTFCPHYIFLHITYIQRRYNQFQLIFLSAFHLSQFLFFSFFSFISFVFFYLFYLFYLFYVLLCSFMFFYVLLCSFISFMFITVFALSGITFLKYI